MKLFFSKFFLTCSLFFLTYTPTFAQQSFVDTAVLTDFNAALKLYYSKAYAPALKIFGTVARTATNNTNVKSDASYYEAMCAVKLNKTDADEKVLKFVAENPTSVKKNKAYFNVGNYYFANKKAAYALKWFQKVAPEQLSKENKKELDFKMGYALLKTNHYKLAKERFLPLINDGKYGNDARYYYGYLAYKLEDYAVAETTLREIADNDSYKAEISYYLLDISFKAGRFNRCVAVGLKLLATANRKEASNISKIIGESYFNLQMYQEAIPYLKVYRGKRGKWNNTDFYQLGYAYYKQNDFKNAINNFNKILDEKNSVSQNAYYHLAECYLNSEKKTEALSAFKAASEMDFDLKIKEDSALNYAKLSYEEGNPFKNVAVVLQEYLKSYPKSKAYDEINNLIVSSFLNQQDYLGALEYLAKNKTKNNNKLHLEVSLYRGIQLYQSKKIKEALPFFTSAKKTSNRSVSLRASYWEAEAQYQLGNHQESLANFIRFKMALKNNKDPEFLELNYTIGYNYFKLKKYAEAIPFFEATTKQNSLEREVLEDAFIRLGDSYFATSAYEKATISYQKVIVNNGVAADYAQYQIGMGEGFRDENEAKIAALNKVITNYKTSSLKDDALYQLGNTYSKINKNAEAHIAYSSLIEKHGNSIFIAKTLIRQGLLYYNDGENNKALEKFKQIVRLFPNSPEAFEAVANARNIYIDNDNVAAYATWVKGLKFINITNSELDNTTFAAAEKKYLNTTNQEKIITSLQGYTSSFPEGIHALKANFYLAETLYKKELFDQAIPSYTRVLSEAQSDFSEASLNKLSQIYLFKEDLDNAIPLLKRLELEANSPTNILYAESNLMQGYYKNQAYGLAIEYAKKILEREKLDKLLKNDAQIIIARSAYKNEDFSTAEAYYAAVAKNATGALKAESLYYNAFFKNKEKAYESSNKIVQKLIADYSAYKYWGVKSYVIMAKNYDGLKDAYQATYVLENIIKNFKEFDDVILEAQTTLDKIKENEAKINRSVKQEEEIPTEEKTKN
jgi:tetratricopeptide (TPR) repeat protein